MRKKIYTKKGDTGITSLLGGKRVPKYHIRVEAYGTVDELKSYLALVSDYQDEPIFSKKVRTIQEKLFTIEALIACEDESIYKSLPRVTEKDVKFLESEIDKMNKVLPELKKFIIPGGNIASSHSHVARCICRRAERIVIKLSEEVPIENIVIAYLNRLSDYLFLLARFLCLEKACKEKIWQPKRL